MNWPPSPFASAHPHLEPSRKTGAASQSRWPGFTLLWELSGPQHPLLSQIWIKVHAWAGGDKGNLREGEGKREHVESSMLKERAKTPPRSESVV